MNEKVAELINKFTQAAILHGQAILQGDSEVANEQYYILEDVFIKLKEIGEQGKEALLGLTNHLDDSVRCWAATYSLPYNEGQAIKTLRALQEKEKSIMGFDAKMVLRQWKKGTLTFD